MDRGSWLVARGSWLPGVPEIGSPCPSYRWAGTAGSEGIEADGELKAENGLGGYAGMESRQQFSYRVRGIGSGR